MAYKDTLSLIIKNSGLSLREISNLCANIGIHITPSYISQVQTGKLNPASESISRAIAKVCNANEDLLVLESYLDNAPKPIIDFIMNSRSQIMSSLLKLFKDKPSEVIDYINNSLYAKSLSEYIISSNRNPDNALAFGNSNFDDSNINISDENKSTIGFNVNDNSLYPLIPKDSYVIVEDFDDYANGDLICLFIGSNSKDYIIRKCFFKDDLVLLIPFNSDYELITCKNDEANILGRVTKVVIDIK